MRLALPPKSCKVYTPSPLADAMITALGDEPDYTWLEPSHGTGAFVEALSRRNVKKERIVAIDLDPAPAPADVFARTIRATDFLRWSSRTRLHFDRIVGNPPYVAISQLPVSLRRTAAAVMDLSDNPIGNGANVWYAFVVASIRLLSRGGSLGFVLPSAAEFASYSATIRTAVRDAFQSVELYRCERPLFSEVQEGSIVAIARNYQGQPFRIARRRFPTPRALIAALCERQRISGKPCTERLHSEDSETIALGSVAQIRVGGVTGDAQYFLMNEDRRRGLKLPQAALTPVVSRARQLRSSFIDADVWTKLKQNGDRIWLFNPSESVKNHPSVKTYLRRRLGGCNRSAFKVANRRPWYRTPLPATPHAFISGMSQFGPWLCINEMPKLNATNTLYVASFDTATQNERYGYALAMMTSNVRKQLRRAGRRYADGLVKFEPSALASLRLPLLPRGLEYRPYYAKAVEALLNGCVRQAITIADSVFSSV